MRGMPASRAVGVLRGGAMLYAALLVGWGCSVVAGVDFDGARALDAVDGGSVLSSDDGGGGAPVGPGGQCPPGQTACDGTCVDTSSSTLHCGRCKSACSPAPNADAVCVDGGCRLTCRQGFVDCTNDPPRRCDPPPKWYVDDDGDGWGTTAFTTGCKAPAGHTALTGDCLDTNATVHPEAGAAEVPYATDAGPSFDYDCDGVETEVDSGRPHFVSCATTTGTCNAIGVLPLTPPRTGTGIDDYCGSSLLEVCYQANGCKQTGVDGGIHIACH